MIKQGSRPPTLMVIFVVLLVAGIFFVLLEFLPLTYTHPIRSFCTAASGFFCSMPVLHNGNLTVAIGQNTGTDWNSATVYFDAGNTTGCTNQPAGTYASYTIPVAFHTGQTVNVTFSGGPVPSSIGSRLYGSLWVNYTYIYSTIPPQVHVGGQASSCVEIATVLATAS